MREIKFRAWHSTTKKMLEVGSILGEGGSFYEEEALGEKDVVLMQYIGRTDLNAVEIYGSDIVEVTVMDGGLHTVIASVVWSDEYGMWTYDRHVAGMFNHIRSTRCKVIGNIYENPELLEKGKE